MCIIYTNSKGPGRTYSAMSPGVRWYLEIMDAFAGKRDVFGHALIEGRYTRTDARGRSIMDGEQFINDQVKARLLQVANGNESQALDALRSNAYTLDEELARLLAPVYASISRQMDAMNVRRGWNTGFWGRFARTGKPTNDPYLKQAQENLQKIDHAFSVFGREVMFSTLLPAPQ